MTNVLRWVMGVMLCFVAVGAIKVQAQEADGNHFIVGLDYFSVADAAHGWGIKGENFEAQLRSNASNTDFSKHDFSLSPGFGARVGVSAAQTSGMDLGMTFGYVYGPAAQTEIKYRSPNLTTARDEFNTQFFRVLIEPGKDVALTEKAAFRIAGGAGYAFGSLKEDVRYDNIATVSNNRRSVSWGGLTWEVSPGFRFYTASGNFVEMGLRFAGFPALKEKDYEFRWNPYGLYFKAGF